MKSLSVILFIFIFPLQMVANEKEQPIIQHDSLVKLNTMSFNFVEGPAWDNSEYIYFSDIPEKKIYRYSKSGGIEVIVNSDVNTNGIFYKFGKLYVCENGGKKVVTYSLSGSKLNTLADGYNDEQFNGPNDLFVDDSGGVYFTDPAFGHAPVSEESVYYIDNEGNTTRIIPELEKPNGVILTNDQKKLIVADTYDKYVYSWDIVSNGVIANKQVYCTLGMDASSEDESGADGMAFDKLGYLYVTSKLGVQVFDTTGAIYDTIVLPDRPTNCTFGGDSLDELYITAQGSFYMVPVKFPPAASTPTEPTRAIKQQNVCPDIKVFQTARGTAFSNIPKNSEISFYNLQGKLIDTFINTRESFTLQERIYGEKVLIVKINGPRNEGMFVFSRKIVL
jgi:gluconolactonase